ncbi:hypothetical protein OPIT5_04805 [Opitutaceae bacterium TAV5]|nr:hypothetical protein OPIT5_04805 [Opitutaceae bacterium TAV5]
MPVLLAALALSVASPGAAPLRADSLSSAADREGTEPATPARATTLLEEKAWLAMRERRFTETMPAFGAATGALPAGSEVPPALAIGRAVALLNTQPRTRDNVARADQLLEGLAAAPDATAPFARYLRARIAEVHLFEPDLKLAAARYQALVDDAPSHPAAQAAVPRLVALRIYRLGDDPARVLAGLEAREPALTDPAALRDYHLVMARSYLFFRISPDLALAHLLRADEAGMIVPANSASVLASIAELAREQGRTDTARAACERFLEKHRRDQRVYMIRRQLAELDGAPAIAAPAPAASASPSVVSTLSTR